MGNEVNVEFINAKKTYADFLKGNKDGNLEATEKEAIEVFQNAVVEAYGKGEINNETFNQAMGLYKSAAATATEATPATEEPTKKEKKAAKKALEAKQDNIKADIKALIEGNKKARLNQDSSISLNNLIEKLTTKNPADHANVIAEVQAVVTFVQATKFNSKKEVEALKDKIKDNKDFNDFQKDLADEMIELAKKEQINKEAEVLVGIYNEVKADPKNAQNFSNYLTLVEKEIENRGLKNTSYYSDEAFDALKQIVNQDATNIADQRRAAMIAEGSENISGKKVKKALLNAASETDKVYEKVVKEQEDENDLTGRWLDKDRTAEDLEKISEKDLKKQLGDELFNVMRKYLESHINADGTYNVRDLSDKLFERVGYDVWMNMSDDTAMSELQGAKNELKILTDRDLNDKDIKKILKLVHIPREPKDRNFMRALKESIIPGIAGAVAGASAYQSLDVTQRVQLNMDSDTATEMINQLKAAGINPSVTQGIDGTITVTVLQRVLQDNRALAALAGAGIGVLTSTLMNLIFGMENNEKSCISIADFNLTEERYTNIDKYKEYIKKVQPEAKANIIIALVDTFHAKYGDDWAKEYDAALKKFAGQGSVLNCLELRGGKLMSVKPVEETEEDTTVEEHRYSQHDQAAVDPTYVDVPAIDGSKTGWPQIARQYECLVEKYQLSGAIRVLKLAQAIKDGNYSQERLDQLYALSKKGRTHLQNIEGFDYKAYCNALDATYLPKLEIKDGKPVPGTGVKVPEKLGDCTRNAELSLQVQGQVEQATVKVAPTGHAADRIQTSAGQGAKYYVRLDGGAIQAYDDKNVRDGIVKKFKEDYPNAKVEKWED